MFDLCRLYTWHIWTQGEIEMFEYPGNHKVEHHGTRVDECACGAKKTIDIVYGPDGKYTETAKES